MLTTISTTAFGSPLPCTCPQMGSVLIEVTIGIATYVTRVTSSLRPCHRVLRLHRHSPRNQADCRIPTSFGWGVIATAQSGTNSWSGMMACRFFLGISESGFGPGIPYLLSFFYLRHEVSSFLKLLFSYSYPDLSRTRFLESNVVLITVSSFNP